MDGDHGDIVIEHRRTGRARLGAGEVPYSGGAHKDSISDVVIARPKVWKHEGLISIVSKTGTLPTLLAVAAPWRADNFSEGRPPFAAYPATTGNQST